MMACVVIAFLGPLPAAGLMPTTVGAAEDGAACSTDDQVRIRMHQLGLVDFSEEPEAGTWQTWFVNPGDVAVPPPPASGSPEDLVELAEVRVAVENRSSNQALVSEIYGQVPAGAYWTELYLDLLVEHAAKDGAKNPPQLSRQMAMFETAMFDAFATVWHYKFCYLRAAPAALDPTIEASVEVPPAPSYPSEHAAAAGVVATIFPLFFPCHDPIGDPEHCEEHPDFWVNEATNATESRIWAGANYRSDVTVGYDIGVEVANAVIAARTNDGYNVPWDGTGRIFGPCNWIPTPPANIGYPAEPNWGNVDPWIMTSGSQFRAPPPPACDGPDYLAQYRDVFEASLGLTDRQRDISDYWEAGQGTVTPPGMNLEVALDKVRENGLNTMRAQRVLAYEAVAVADAAVAAWDTKFTYWSDRPLIAIRRHGWDVEAGVCHDNNVDNGEGIDADFMYGGCWLSHAVTPPFPGYVSGHSTFTGAGQETLKYFFPDDAREFNAYQTEAAMARFYGGIHHRADNDQGVEMGRSIAHLLWDRARNDGADE